MLRGRGKVNKTRCVDCNQRLWTDPLLERFIRRNEFVSDLAYVAARKADPEREPSRHGGIRLKRLALRCGLVFVAWAVRVCSH